MAPGVKGGLQWWVRVISRALHAFHVPPPPPFAQARPCLGTTTRFMSFVGTATFQTFSHNCADLGATILNLWDPWEPIVCEKTGGAGLGHACQTCC